MPVSQNNPESRSRIHIFMELEYSAFTENARAQFLEDLANTAGILIDEISDYSFKKGCVIFEGEANEEAIKYLVEQFDKYKNGKEEDCDENFLAFIKKNNAQKIYKKTILRFEYCKEIGDKNGKKLIFVHGLMGDDKSFGQLPQLLEASLETEALVYEYGTSILKQSPSLITVAQNLDNWIRNRSYTGNLAIIAHSMGGLVTKRLLTEQIRRNHPLDERVRQVTLIASPHSGEQLAKVASLIPFLENTQLKELSPDSPFIVDVNSNWNYWVRNNVPQKCNVRSIYGMQDKIVPPGSAVGIDDAPIPIPNVGHRDIVKPKNADDEIVITLVRLIRESNFFQ